VSWQPPKYIEIANDLRAKIKDGTYPPGTQLPPENQLREQWGRVTHGTVRNALNQLRNEGLVVSYRGRGVFVQEPTEIPPVRWKPDTPGELRGYHATQARRKQRPAYRYAVRRELPPDDVAQWLDLDPGTEVLVRDRLLQSSGEPPDMLSVTWHPLETVERIPRLAEETPPAEGEGSLIDWVEAAYGPVHFADTLRSRMPEPAERRRLELANGTPVMEVGGITYAQDGTPLYYVRKVVASNRLRIGYTYGPGAPGWAVEDEA
jgi:GntR family transcriptional regulator